MRTYNKNNVQSLRILLAIWGIIGFGLLAQAQRDLKLTGVVKETNGNSLSGVFVLVKGTTIGTTTDMDGQFALAVPEQGATLVFSFLGYATQEIEVRNQTDVQVILVEELNKLNEVVVTALGISREKKALGYAVQDVGSTELITRPTNALSSISGKVSGLQVIASGGNMGGSTRVTLRGINSIAGNNQPLYVIDGVPIDNSDLNTALTSGGSAGKDVGNMIQDLNPDDIENISVLKGPSAAALYGTRASNGVILLTTKKGSDKKGLGIVVNTGLEFENIVRLPKRQKLYGQGYASEDKNTQALISNFETANIGGKSYLIPNYAADESWGPRLDGTPVLHWYNLDPEFAEDYMNPQPWSYPEHDVNYFFRTGISNTNNVAIAGSGENTTYRLSLTNKNVRGTMPNSSLNRNSVNFSGSSRLGKINVFSNINYIKNTTMGRPWTGASNRNIMLEAFQWGAVQVDYKKLSEYQRADGTPRPWNRTSLTNPATKFIDNPYWSANESYMEENRDRFYGNVGFTVEATDWLNLTGRMNGDVYIFQYQDRIAVFSRSQSQYQEYSNTFNEFNYEFMATANKRWDDFSLSANLGTNVMDQRRWLKDMITQGGLIVPLFYSLKNAPSMLTNNRFYHKRINSIYGSISLGWKGMYYVDGTVRNDWSSTLPAKNNSFVYPSVTGSVILSELDGLKALPWLTFAKVRLGWAQVGNDTDPYQLEQAFEAQQPFDGKSSYRLPILKNNPDLRPEITSSIETGLSLQFFKSRLVFDITYYNNNSRDQILPVQVSSAFGYEAKVLNAGKINNQGMEVTLSGTPIETKDFGWDASINWSRNRNKVVNLLDGKQSTLLLDNTLISLEAREGEAYGQLVNYSFVYAPDGQRVIGADGTYMRTDQKVAQGSVLPDFLFGLQQTFRYKNFALGVLIDGRVGGVFYSQTYKIGMYAGILEPTAANNIRETGTMLNGVNADVVFNSDGTYQVSNARPNATRISALAWARNGYNGPGDFNIFDATFVKLREVTLGYTFDLKESPVKGLVVTLYGRNLWNIYTKSKFIDPEFTNSGGNVQGVEGGNLPIPMSYGLNVGLKF